MELLFPVADKEMQRVTKSYLEQYRKAKKIQETIPEAITDRQRSLILDMERAFAIILDDETKAIMQYRYVEGHSHKITILHFCGRMDEATINRKLARGIESIANTLLLCGQLRQARRCD